MGCICSDQVPDLAIFGSGRGRRWYRRGAHLREHGLTRAGTVPFPPSGPTHIPTGKEDQCHNIAVSDAAAAAVIQPGSVVSKVIHRNETLEVTVFGFDAGEGLTEHQASRAAIAQVLTGRLRFTADGEELDAGPGFWLHMAPGTPHALVATEPSMMLLTLFRG